MLKYKLYINDILRAIKITESTTKNKSFEDFNKNKNLIDATAMRIQIIGESAKKLPENLKRKMKETNWAYLEGLRNIISHAYFRVNTHLLWGIVKNEIPKLKKDIQKIRGELD